MAIEVKSLLIYRKSEHGAQEFLRLKNPDIPYPRHDRDKFTWSTDKKTAYPFDESHRTHCLAEDLGAEVLLITRII